MSKENILFVQILKAKPNKLFTQEQTDSVRFLRYSKSVPCAECGKKKKTLWTMLCQFKANTFEKIDSIDKGKKSHSPLTPVCQSHLLAPDID